MAETLERLTAIIEADVSRLDKGTRDAARMFDARASEIEYRNASLTAKLERQWQAFGSSFGILSRFLSVAALEEFARHIITTTADIADQAREVGVSISALQTYRNVMQDSGGSAEEADALIRRLTLSIGQAKEQASEARDAFAALNLGPADLSGGTEQTLARVAKALLEIPDPARRARLENELFGKSGQDLERVLTDLAGGLDALTQKYRDQGRILDDETVLQYKEAVDELTKSWQQFTIATAQPLSYLVQGFADLVRYAKQLVDIIPKDKDLFGFDTTILGRKPSGFNAPFAGPDSQAILRGGGPASGRFRTRDEDAAAKKFETDQKNFRAEVQSKIDEADQHEAEAKQEFLDKRQQLIDDADEKEALAKQEFLDKRQALIDEADQREAEAAQETIDEIKQRWDDYYQHQAEAQQELSDRIADVSRGFIDDLTTLLAEGGNHWRDYARIAVRAIEEIIRAQEQFDRTSGATLGLGTILRAFGFGGGGSAGGAGDIGDIGDIPGRAAGGGVSAGKLYRINERGMEFFRPDVSGNVIPLTPRIPQVSAANGGMSISVTNQIALDGANGDAAIAQMARAAAARGTADAIALVRKNFAKSMVVNQRRKF